MSNEAIMLLGKAREAQAGAAKRSWRNVVGAGYDGFGQMHVIRGCDGPMIRI